MDAEIICLDTSILIDYFRKSKKEQTLFFDLSKSFCFAVSVITKLEIYSGATDEQKEFWNKLFAKMLILPINEQEINVAIDIIKTLRKENQIIDLADILIAATAITNHLKLSTLNIKHFNRIANLKLINC